jgi:hypothetical protein
MTEYYGRMKSGLGSIDPKDMAQLSEDWMIATATGAAIGLMSGGLGGLDKKIAGINVPLDGLVAMGLGVFGLQAGGSTGKTMKIASIAAGGSAAVRTFEKFFKAGFKVKGEFEDLGSSGLNYQMYGRQPQEFGPGVGFGVGEQDRLVEAARYL